jgi:hypothetical protein
VDLGLVDSLAVCPWKKKGNSESESDVEGHVFVGYLEHFHHL